MAAERVETPEMSGAVESEVSSEHGVTQDGSGMAYIGSGATTHDAEGSQEDMLEAIEEILAQGEQKADARDHTEKDSALPQAASSSSPSSPPTSGHNPVDSTQAALDDPSKVVTGPGTSELFLIFTIFSLLIHETKGRLE